MKQSSLLTSIVVFLLFFITNVIGQNAEIGADFKITINTSSNNAVYVIDIAPANFANESEALQVFNFYQRHPLLTFDLNYAESQVTLSVQEAALSTNNDVDVNFLNSLLERRATAYNRKY